MLVAASSGCVGYVDRPPARTVYVSPPPQPQPVIIEQDDYVYYPAYQVYYGSRSHLYYYQEGRTWVSQPRPRGVSVNVLLSAPSVQVAFHDRPATHHSEVVRAYPKHWTPPNGGKHNQKEDHGPNHGNGNK